MPRDTGLAMALGLVVALAALAVVRLLALLLRNVLRLIGLSFNLYFVQVVFKTNCFVNKFVKGVRAGASTHKFLANLAFKALLIHAY